jgi:pimeloyl-ACP methyl ester carboxylesterase
MNERSVELAGRATLRVVERGDRRGRPVVLLHGLADSWRVFQPTIEELPPSLHIIAVTQRGHGDASRPTVGYGLPDLSADVLALLDALAVERAVIVGHSMGSAVALRFAVDHPERVRGLVLIGAGSQARGTPAARAYWDRVLAELHDPIPRDFVTTMAERSFVKCVPPELLATLIDESAKVPLHVWQGLLAARWRGDGDYANELTRVTAPTLLLWGDRDSRYPRSEQEALLAGIHGARLVVFAGAGHMLHVEEAEWCAREIGAFVDETR